MAKAPKVEVGSIVWLDADDFPRVRAKVIGINVKHQCAIVEILPDYRTEDDAPDGLTEVGLQDIYPINPRVIEVDQVMWLKPFDDMPQVKIKVISVNTQRRIAEIEILPVYQTEPGDKGVAEVPVSELKKID